MNEWRKYLKKGGYLRQFLNVHGFTDERPAEINDFWMDAYPEIDTISNQVAKQGAGYLPVATFILPGKLLDRSLLTPKLQLRRFFN